MFRNLFKCLTVGILLCLPGLVSAVDKDTVPKADSLLVDSLPADSIPIVDSVKVTDTITDRMELLKQFEDRYKTGREQQQEEETPRRPVLRYFDSLTAYFVSPRQNQREYIDRAYFHDAGDYFKFDPSYFVNDFQATPMRKTVQPYGLSGDRLDVLINGFTYTPFDYVVEPDGMMDLNDIPTALDHDVYIMPGPSGRIIGSEQGISTLMTRPLEPDSTEPRSAFLVDKGSFGYSYARGKFSRRFVKGRKIDMSIGYRNADGADFKQNDDAYHYFGDFYFPMENNFALRAIGQLYNREGYLALHPDTNGVYIKRNRFDRNLRLALTWDDPNHVANYELLYHHQRSKSALAEQYVEVLDYTTHSAELNRHWLLGEHLYKAGLKASYLEMYDGKKNYSRGNSELILSYARLKKGWRYAFTGGVKHDDAYRFLPNLTGLLFYDSPRWFVEMSGGYNERAPSLLETRLEPGSATFYGRAFDDYHDQGNPDLLSEKQLTGNLTLQYGSLENKIGVSVTGGRIFDGIDWERRFDINPPFVTFTPGNGIINFITTTLTGDLALNDFMHWHSGGSYHFTDYELFENRPYKPDYQAFSGLELHVYWRQRDLHFYAYGELAYVGPYDGYQQLDLGNDAIFNAKVSVRLGTFRFHYVFLDVLSKEYYGREEFLFPGRYSYYGFTWDFMD